MGQIIYEVPWDAHAAILRLFLKLGALNDRREAHLVRLIKSFISAKCHPAMPSLVGNGNLRNAKVRKVICEITYEKCVRKIGKT